MPKSLLLNVIGAAVMITSAVGLYHARASGGKRQALSTFHQWEHEVENGGPGKSFWKYPDEADRFFAVRSCKILSVHDQGEEVTIGARIESSNRAGMPIVADWTFAVLKTDNDWKIDAVTAR